MLNVNALAIRITVHLLVSEGWLIWIDYVVSILTKKQIDNVISIPIIDPNFRRHSIFRLYNDGAVEDGSSLSDGSYKHTHLSFVCCIGACSCFRSRRTTPTTEQHFQWTQIHTLTQSSKRKK